MSKNVDMVAIQTKKANAQNLTCFIAFVASASIAGILMAVAWALPAIIAVTKITCWISMVLEAAAIGLVFVACWIKKNAL
jgi:hypothetical protein